MSQSIKLLERNGERQAFRQTAGEARTLGGIGGSRTDGAARVPGEASEVLEVDDRYWAYDGEEDYPASDPRKAHPAFGARGRLRVRIAGLMPQYVPQGSAQIADSV